MRGLLTLIPALAYAALDLTVSTDGSYAVSLNGVDWLTSPPKGGYSLFYDGKPHRASDGTLKLDAPPAPIAGSDALGAYTGYAASFIAALFNASFKLYAAKHALVFSQAFPGGLSGMASGAAGAEDDLATAFPVFGPARANLSSNLAFLVRVCAGL